MNDSELLEAVLELVEDDFCYDMDCRLIRPDPEFTQNESRKMAEKLGRIYSIAHRKHCKACNSTERNRNSPTACLIVMPCNVAKRTLWRKLYLAHDKTNN